MGTGQENYIDLVERITRIETEQQHADKQRSEMAADIKETKDLLAKLVKAQEVRDARFGGVLWAATAMASAVSVVIKIAWEWFHKGGP